MEGFPDLPAVSMGPGTIGRTYVDPVTGKTFRPSMSLTLTLPSYGRVRDGVPVNPETYDYRRAALDALLFPRLLDRFWQNLRRCAACKVQYFSAVEAQRRLAPHLHAAVRGAIPRATLRAVVRATYYAAWWPSVDRVVYADDRVPVWHSALGSDVHPDTGEVLPPGSKPSTSSTNRCVWRPSAPNWTSKASSAAPSSPPGRCATCASTSPDQTPHNRSGSDRRTPRKPCGTLACVGCPLWPVRIRRFASPILHLNRGIRTSPPADTPPNRWIRAEGLWDAAHRHGGDLGGDAEQATMA